MEGSKYGDDIRDKARILLASGKTVVEVSEELSIPIRTLYDWKCNWKDDADFAQLRKQQKEQEEEKMTDIINKALTRLQSSIDTVQGDKLPTIIGTIYDKRALSRGEATQNQDLVIRVTLKDEH